MNEIHPTAIVHDKAILGTGNYIGPYCLIGENVKIGSFNRLEAFVSIGSPAEHKEAFHKEKDCGVLIGDDCVFREYVTVNSGMERQTKIGNNNYFLRGSHVGHDSEVINKVTVSCNTMIGGHSTIKSGTNIGLGTVIHQYITIGHFAMIGMGSVVTKDVSDFVLGYGNPFKPKKINRIGLLRNNFTEAQVNELEQMSGLSYE